MGRLYGDLADTAEAKNIASEALALAQQAIVEIGAVTSEPVAVSARLLTFVKPKSGTALSAGSFTIIGNDSLLTGGSSLSHPALANTNILTSTYRTRINTSTATGVNASIRFTTAMVHRGSSAALGGFKLVMRWGGATALAQQRAFFGLSATTSGLANANPSTFTELIGVGYDSAETNYFLVHNDGSGTATRVDLGGNFPVNTSSLFELILTAEPGASTVNYTLTNVGTGDKVEGVASSDLPTNTTFLTPHMWQNNGSTAASSSLDIACLYLESYQ